MKSKFIKNSLIIIFIICACIMLVTTLFACDEASYTLTFVADGKVIATFEGKEGSEVSLPAAPQKDDLNFEGWYDDPDFGEGAKLAPDVMPAHDATYYAKYVANVGYTLEYHLQKLNSEKTAAVNEYELGGTFSFKGAPGTTVSVPETLENAPQGFVRKANGNEKLSLTLGEDESKNVLKVYFDRIICTVRFDANGGAGEMQAQTYPYGATVSGNFANAFTRDGWRFAGFECSYDNGDPIPNIAFTIVGNATFKATWHIGYKNAADESDVVYFDGTAYYRMTDGARESAELTMSMSEYGFDEFVFDGEEGEKICRLYRGENTFRVCGEEAGVYVRYDYITRSYYAFAHVLSLDGFGFATYSEIGAGSAIQVLRSGNYKLSEQQYDYEFDVIDPATNERIGTDYFTLSTQKPEEITDEHVTGSFILEGAESGEFVEYSVLDGEMNDGEILQLFGDGSARIMGYDLDTEDYTEIISEGIYYGTNNYYDYMGEWLYQPLDDKGAPTGESFKFMLNAIIGDDSFTPIYMRYEQKLDAVFIEEGENGGRLTIGGYNGAEYAIGGTTTTLSGAIAMLGESTLRFTPYDEDGEAQPSINFDLDWIGRTFKQNETGLLTENGVLTGYVGTSSVVKIPDDVTEIAVEALKYNNTGVSLTHVTIPASVTKIGARAFENNYTLTSVVFEGTTPIEGIDWSNAANPFRWPSEGAFKIYVPNEALEAYRAAWSDCPYKITSVFEENNKPEFEVDENGVLLSYNCKTENPANLSIKLTDEVKTVAKGVFAHISYIASVDLNNVTEIGVSAFEGCGALKSVTAGKLETIGEAAFALCTSLESISLPAAKSIGDQAFAACEKLEHVSLGAGIQRIGDRAFSECATTEMSTLFILELADGADVPVMGDDIFHGCFGFRVSVATVEDALALYDGSGRGWNKYAGRATVRANEKSALAGEWIDVTTLGTVTVGGRLETTYNTYVYSLSGETLTLYEYNGETGGYATVNGAYKDGRISFEDSGESFTLVKLEGKLNYKSSAGETLVIDLDSYNVEEIPSSEGYASTMRITVGATFEGQEGVISVTGNRLVLTGLKLDSVTIEDKEHKDIKCALTLKLGSAGNFTYTTELNDVRGPYTAADGSYINLVYHGTGGRFLSTSLCMTGCLKEFVNVKGEPIVVESLDTWQVIDIPADDTYVFVYNWLSDRYYVTVTLDEASKTFTYSAEKAASRVVLSGSGAEKVVVLLDKDGKTILGLSLLLPYGDGTDTLYVREFTLQADGSYLVEAEQRVVEYDPNTETYVQTLGPLSGEYLLTLDLDARTCTIVRHYNEE